MTSLAVHRALNDIIFVSPFLSFPYSFLGGQAIIAVRAFSPETWHKKEKEKLFLLVVMSLTPTQSISVVVSSDNGKQYSTVLPQHYGS